MAIPTYLHSNPLIRWLFWKRYETIANLTQPTSKTRILEFGCGIGAFLPTLCAYSDEVYATDLVMDFAKELARRRDLKVNFVHIDDLPDKSIDLLIAADVLEHLEDLDQWLLRFKRLLNEGGELIVSGPTENVIYKLGRIAAGFISKGEYHKSNILSIDRAITSSGFTKTKEYRLPFSFPPYLFKVIAYKVI